MPTTPEQDASQGKHPPKTIVIADDQEEARLFIRAALRLLRCHIVEAENGQVALDMVRAYAPALLLLDWMMPQLDGLEVARALRSDPTTAALPILMVSAKGEEAKAQAYEAGVSDYLGKPFTLAQLRQRVRTLLGEEG
jgi:two-component system phosphate regulon response regulator PhoB